MEGASLRYAPTWSNASGGLHHPGERQSSADRPLPTPSPRRLPRPPRLLPLGPRPKFDVRGHDPIPSRKRQRFSGRTSQVWCPEDRDLCHPPTYHRRPCLNRNVPTPSIRSLEWGCCPTQCLRSAAIRFCRETVPMDPGEPLLPIRSYQRSL